MNEERWIERFEQAGWLGRAALLGGGAVRLAAQAIDHTLDRAAQVVVEAQDAFRKELDPNVSDARILEESDEPLDDDLREQS
jgi:hypothetical protein